MKTHLIFGAILMALVVLLVQGGGAIAASRSWINPSGGFFSDPNNWSGKTVPGPADLADFPGGGASFTVWFNSNTETSRLTGVEVPGTVTFDLGGHTYVVGGGGPYAVCPSGGTLRVVSGILSVPTGAVFLSNSGSKMFIGDGGSLQCYQADIGHGAGSGEIIVEDGGLVGVSNHLTLCPYGVARLRTGSVLNVTNWIELQPDVWTPGALIMEGGTARVGQILAPDGTVLEKGGVISGFGTIQGRVAAGASTTISANGGHLQIGDATSLDGFSTGGLIEVGTADLTLNSLSYAELGKLTTLGGGTLWASNGVYLKDGSNISGWGRIGTSIAAAGGSSIYATGTLRLGDSNAYDGIGLDGRLFVSSHTVTLDDRNEAVLGALTTIEGGALAAPNGLLVNFGRNLVGRGRVETPNDPTKSLINNGAIAGDSMAAPLVLTGYVKGVGSIDNVIFEGTYAPGFSPARVYVGNMGFGELARVVMELEGTAAGEYDQLVSSGLLNLGGTLDIELLGGFIPEYGSVFKLFDGSLVGTFGDIDLPALPTGLVWGTDSLYSDGALSVVPEPTTLSLLALGGLMALRRRR